jgi:hypothetical protein
VDRRRGAWRIARQGDRRIGLGDSGRGVRRRWSGLQEGGRLGGGRDGHAPAKVRAPRPRLRILRRRAQAGVWPGRDLCVRDRCRGCVDLASYPLGDRQVGPDWQQIRWSCQGTRRGGWRGTWPRIGRRFGDGDPVRSCVRGFWPIRGLPILGAQACSLLDKRLRRRRFIWRPALSRRDRTDALRGGPCPLDIHGFALIGYRQGCVDLGCRDRERLQRCCCK